MRSCLTAQSEWFTRPSLAVGQHSGIITIKTWGEEGRDTRLVDCRLEERDRETERQRERERERERESSNFTYVMMLLNSSPHLSSVLRKYAVKPEWPVVAENQLILTDQSHTLLTRLEPFQLQQWTNLHVTCLKQHTKVDIIYHNHTQFHEFVWKIT